MARYSRYTLTPLFAPYSPAGASCQHPGSKSTAAAGLGAVPAPQPLDRPSQGTSARSISSAGALAASRSSAHELHHGLLTRVPVYWGRVDTVQPRLGVPTPQCAPPAGSQHSPVHRPCPQSPAPAQQPELSAT